MKESVTIDFAGRPFTIDTGELAKQQTKRPRALCDTVVLVTAVARKEESKNDFLPLTVNYQRWPMRPVSFRRFFLRGKADRQAWKYSCPGS